MSDAGRAAEEAADEIDFLCERWNLGEIEAVELCAVARRVLDTYSAAIATVRAAQAQEKKEGDRG